MNKPLTIEDLLKMKEVLDENAVPEEGRSIHYLDLNEQEVFLSKDTEVTKEMIEAMPTWIRALFIGGVNE